MALPKINVPKYKLKLPSTGKVVNFRPFLVREEKLLLLATQTGETEELVEAITKIVSDCTDVKDVKNLSTFDIEYLFLQIRTKSVGETVNISLTMPDDSETEVDVEIPLDEITVKTDKTHKTELKLSDEIIVSMGYPSLEMFVKMNFSDDDTNQIEQVFEMAAGCVKTISDPDQVYDCADVSKKELIEWFEELNSKQFGMIQEFFETMPKLSHTLKVTNPNTGVENEIVLEGLASFFG
ncbi:baseplate hub [Synechococcus phage ACG-2014g]|jgi:hypothetical protein|uniref:Baseplate hub subunit n=1 Tax=Synechococcus phage ACG-2014g TaxID=1493512 RepID=A0A0E3FBZ2_9CAUD|nr:baseplate hub [Synechococcus phage ACG-2014g]AIX24351.1 baseplate hub subunit [Synechococcus phage ACG-2014g]